MNDQRKGVAFVAIAALLWSSGGLGIKAVEASPLAVAMWRSFFAAAALFVFTRPRLRRSGAFVVSLVCYAGCLLTFVTATKWTTAANAIFLQYSGVIWVMLLSPLLLDEKRTRRDVVAIIVALAGMALFFVGRFEARGVNGNALALLSGVFFAGLVLTLRKQGEDGADEAAVTWGNMLLALLLFPLVAQRGELALDGRSYAILAALGVIQIGLAYYFFIRGLRHISATHASLTGMLEPVANPIWVLLAFDERPTPYAIVGGAIVLGAVAWRTVTERPPTTALPPD